MAINFGVFHYPVELSSQNNTELSSGQLLDVLAGFIIRAHVT